VRFACLVGGYQLIHFFHSSSWILSLCKSCRHWMQITLKARCIFFPFFLRHVNADGRIHFQELDAKITVLPNQISIMGCVLPMPSPYTRPPCPPAPPTFPCPKNAPYRASGVLSSSQMRSCHPLYLTVECSARWLN
jgi:hypothetical protein